MGERTRDKAIPPKNAPVLPLHDSCHEMPHLPWLSCMRHCKGEGNRIAADAYFTLMVSHTAQTIHKACFHFLIRKYYRNFQNKFFRRAIASDAKSGKPPVNRLRSKQRLPPVIQAHRNRQHIRLIHSVKKCLCILLGRYNRIRIINTYLRPDINTVLPLPQFNSPSAACLFKINRFAVKHHSKFQRTLIIQRTVAKFFLECIYS